MLKGLPVAIEVLLVRIRVSHESDSFAALGSLLSLKWLLFINLLESLSISARPLPHDDFPLCG